MPSRHSRIAPTKAVHATARGPVRTMHSAEPPVCTQCGTNEHVIRIWHGRNKMWVCNVHYRVTSTKKKEPTLKQRLLHQLPEADTLSVSDILPNRRARRSHLRGR